MRPVVVVCALGTLALSVGAQCAGTAVAAGHAISQRTDPQAGSPAGVIYQIPLDTGRRDAAPVLHIRGRHSAGSAAAGRGGGSGGAGGSAGANSSGVNGRGEASHSAASNGGGFGGGGGVGGGEANGAVGSEAGSAASGGGTPNNPSSIHSENGFGSSSQVPGVSPAALRIGAGVPSAQTPSSTLPTYLLMALIGLAAVAVGLITARGTRGTPGSQGIPK